MNNKALYTDIVSFGKLDELNQVAENIYIPEQDLLSQLPIEMLMFIHLRTIGKIKFGSKIDDCNFPAFKKILKTSKKSFKKDRESILDDLFDYLGYEQYLNSDKKLDIKKIFDENYCNENLYYKCLKEIFDELWSEIYEDINISSEDDLQLKIIESLKKQFIPKAIIYNLVLLLMVYENVLQMSNSEPVKDKNLSLTSLINFIFINILTIENEIHQKYRDIVLQMSNFLDEEKETFKKRTIELTECKNKIKELNKSKKFLEKKIKTDSEKLEEYFNTLNFLQDKLKDNDINIINILEEIKNIKTNVTKNIYDNIINNLNEKVSDLKSSLKEKSKEYNDLNKKYKVLNNKSTISILKEYIELNGLTDDLKEIVKPYISIYKDDISPALENEDYIENQYIDNDNTNKNKENIEDEIGYCVIADNKHYVRFLNGKTVELINMPECTYLAEGQIVLASYNGNFKFAFQYTCSGIELELNSMIKFAAVTVIDDEYRIGFNGNFQILKNVPNETKLKTMQVVIADEEGNYIRTLKRIYLTADNLVTSMKIKGHTPYFVINSLSKNRFLLREIDSDIEIEKEIFSDSTIIKIHSVIGVNKNNELMSYFPTGRFYTLSSYYKKVKYGIVEIDNNVIYANIIEDVERIKISDIPQNIILETDDIVKLDEFGELLEVIEVSDTNIDNRKGLKIKKNRRNNKEKDSILRPTKDILILGNIAYAEAYKESFLNKGYNAYVSDGYESWNKVLRDMKNKDLVILIIDFVSHDNMFNIKETTQPAIFSKFDGANMLAAQALIYFTEHNN